MGLGGHVHVGRGCLRERTNAFEVMFRVRCWAPPFWSSEKNVLHPGRGVAPRYYRLILVILSLARVVLPCTCVRDQGVIFLVGVCLLQYIYLSSPGCCVLYARVLLIVTFTTFMGIFFQGVSQLRSPCLNQLVFLN